MPKIRGQVRVGQQFGRLTVLRLAGVFQYLRYWLCVCICGKPSLVPTISLTKGSTKSCGCLRIDKAKANGKHNMWRSPEYRAWVNMVARCSNSKHALFKWYGKRGISVCSEWREEFKRFYKDVGPRLSDQHSLGRIDNDGNYEPANVRWMTQRDQKRNTRRNRHFTIKGRRQVVSDWAHEYRISVNTVRARLNRGQSIEKALGLPRW